MKKKLLIGFIAILALAACTAPQGPGQDEPKDNDKNVEKMAKNWIKQAPTYAYDGFNLTLEDHQVLESYPEQHVLTYKFKSRHGGYGNRSGQMVTQVITPHTIKIKIVNGTVKSAVIDEEWDELRQEPLVKESTQLSYQPMQCEKAPWEEWYEEGNAQFAKEPTDEELIKAYYGDKGVDMKNVEKVKARDAACQACYTCPTIHRYDAEVSSGVQTMKDDGWNVTGQVAERTARAGR